MAKAPKVKTCGATHCLCESPLVNEGEGVFANNRWFHPLCFKAREAQKRVVDIYYKDVNSTVVMKQLQATINNLLYDKRCNPDLLVFAIRYAVKNHIAIKSPYSLQYLVNNNRILDAFERYKQRAATVKRMVSRATNTEEDGVSFVVAEPKRGGFGSVLQGKEEDEQNNNGSDI